MSAPEDLPSELADAFAAELLAAAPADRDAVVARWVARESRHERTLRRLADELSGVESMLDATFVEPRRDDPRTIAGHRVLETIGEGAFGVVYRCRQERPVVRDVAIKVLRPGAGDQQTLRRFAAERQALATLSHPTITPVFDAGELPDGRPFFVMEHVVGPTIRDYCERRALVIAERLRLFVQLCRGVAHAHSRGIVHRDLKPANILVVDGADGPMPKIVDFGIAKALFPTAGGDVLRTDAGRVIGTPGYMSPEQAAGRVDEVDGRADVFSLGVVLYELLTGVLPWPRGASATDTDPTVPSRRATADARDGAAALRGDLDWIVMKALARERAERYGSVGALVADIERHLDGDTVSVGPPSVRYRLRKLVARRRGAIAIAASIGIAVLGLAAALVYGWHKENEAATAKASSVSDSRVVVARLLASAQDPALFGTEHGDTVRLALSKEALRLAAQLAADAPGDARLQADHCHVLTAVAQVHWLLGEIGTARDVATKAVGIAKDLQAASPSALGRGLLGTAQRELGRALLFAGDGAGGFNTLVEAAANLEGAVDAGSGAFAKLQACALREAGDCVPDRDGARRIELKRKAVEILTSLRADPARRDETQEDWVSAQLGLARALRVVDRFDDAHACLDRVAPELANLKTLRDRHTSDYHALRAQVAWERGERESTIADFTAAADAAVAWRDAQPRRDAAHRLCTRRLGELAYAQNYIGRFAPSSASYRRAVAAAEALIDQFPDDPSARAFLCEQLCVFAYVLRDRFRRSDLAEAAALVRRAIEVDATMPSSVVFGRRPRWLLLTTLAGIEESRGGPEEDRTWADVARALDGAATPGPADRDLWLEAKTGVAAWCLENGEIRQAEAHLDEARACIATDRNEAKRLIEVGVLDARIAILRGNVAGAAAAADRILAARNTWFGTLHAADCLRLACRAAGKDPMAGPWAERAVDLYRRGAASIAEDVAAHPDDPWFVAPWGFATVHLARFAADGGDTAAASTLLDKALPLLEAVRAEAQLDQWDEEALVAARKLRERLGQPK